MTDIKSERAIICFISQTRQFFFIFKGQIFCFLKHTKENLLLIAVVFLIFVSKYSSHLVILRRYLFLQTFLDTRVFLLLHLFV